MKKYKTIVIDPPWEYGKWCANLHRPNSVDKAIPYKTMKIKEIEALPINSIADENCELFLWTTQKYLPEAIYLIDKWNFKYCPSSSFQEIHTFLYFDFPIFRHAGLSACRIGYTVTCRIFANS